MSNGSCPLFQLCSQRVTPSEQHRLSQFHDAFHLFMHEGVFPCPTRQASFVKVAIIETQVRQVRQESPPSLADISRLCGDKASNVRPQALHGHCARMSFNPCSMQRQSCLSPPHESLQSDRRPHASVVSSNLCCPYLGPSFHFF